MIKNKRVYNDNHRQNQYRSNNIPTTTTKQEKFSTPSKHQDHNPQNTDPIPTSFILHPSSSILLHPPPSLDLSSSCLTPSSSTTSTPTSSTTSTTTTTSSDSSNIVAEISSWPIKPINIHECGPGTCEVLQEESVV